MNGLLVSPLIKGTEKNIGDYIQSIAQEQFWEKIDCLVERERLASFKSDETVNLIVQGWFMWTPEEFPPSKHINPYFISFHLTPFIADKLLNEKAITYFKKYAPIGCRDYQTLNILESKGIPCYYSSCLTLTLGLNYSSNHKNNEIYIVDPHFEMGGSKQYSKLKRIYNIISTIFCHYNTILKLKKVFISHLYKTGSDIKSRIYSLMQLASYYYTYSQIFDDELLLKAKYVTHIIHDDGSLSEYQKLDLARKLVNKYASAKLVITSRIHAALPAIAVETPTIFISSSNLERGNPGAPGGRFDGIIDLMNSFYFSSKGIISGSTNNILKDTDKIGINAIVINSEKYKELKDELINRVNSFVDKCKSKD